MKVWLFLVLLAMPLAMMGCGDDEPGNGSDTSVTPDASDADGSVTPDASDADGSDTPDTPDGDLVDDGTTDGEGDADVEPDSDMGPDLEPTALQPVITFASGMGDVRTDNFHLIVLIGGPEPMGRAEGETTTVELGPAAVLNQ